MGPSVAVRRTSRKDRPTTRVRLALKRVSKNRWLSPDEVIRLGTRLSKCASFTPHQVLAHAVRDECFVVGMIGGEPPVFRYEPHYRATIKVVQSTRSKGDIAVLLAMLKVTCDHIEASDENHR